MSDDPSKSRSMNDISHLFLSNVRDLHGNGSARPRRTPPADGVAGAAPQQPLTADEVDRVTAGPHDAAVGGPAGDPGDDDGLLDGSADAAAETAPVTAVLASHLNGRMAERVREYARHLTASAGRVGLIDLDVTDFRLTCFDPVAEPGSAAAVAGGTIGAGRPAEVGGAADPREVAAALEELNLDVDRWVLVLPSLRTPEASALLADAEHWALLCTPDHDGVVAAYKTLKGVAEMRAGGDGRPATRLSVAVLDAAGDAEAARVQQKVAGVSRQFLGWDADAEPPVRYAAGVAEHPLMNCRVGGGRGQGVVGHHWAAVAELLARPRRGASAAAAAAAATAANIAAAARRTGPAPEPTVAAAADVRRIPVAMTEPPEPRAVPAAAIPASPAGPAEPSRMRIEPAAVVPPPAAFPPNSFPSATFPTVTFPAAAAAWSGRADDAGADDEVLDLPGDAADPRGILAAVLRRPDWALAECPIAPPGCAAATRVAVGRDRGLVLAAVAARGLADLRAIGRAYRWLAENAPLVAMALPQFAIDPNRTIALHLLVDQADLSGDALRALLGADHVRVRAYRTLRWAGRTGLLLDAA